MAGGMTGMDVTKASDVMDAFGDIKKATTKLQYISFTIDIKKEGNKHLGEFRLVDKVAKKDGQDSKGAYEELLATLKPDEPLFVIFDTQFTTADGREQQKLGMLVWCPDSVNVKRKMMIGSNAEAIKGALDGVSKVCHATDIDEASWETYVGMW